MFSPDCESKEQSYFWEKDMRILLQNCENGSYFAGCHRWVADANRAFDFEKTAAAVAFVQNLPDPGELQVIMCFDDTNYDYWLGDDELG